MNFFKKSIAVAAILCGLIVIAGLHGQGVGGGGVGGTDGSLSPSSTNSLANTQWVHTVVDSATNSALIGSTNLSQTQATTARDSATNLSQAYTDGATNDLVDITVFNNGTNSAVVDATNRAAIYTRAQVGGSTSSVPAAVTITNIQAGASVTVDLTNPKAPIIASTASGGGASSNVVARWSTDAAYGGTDTMIVRFLNQIIDTGAGTAWNITTNAANAMKVTILQNGQYAAGGTMDNANTTGAGVFGLSVNSTELTTPIYGINPTNRLQWVYVGSLTGATHAEGSWQGYLYSNDVLRVHTIGGVPTTVASCQFWINQIVR